MTDFCPTLSFLFGLMCHIVGNDIRSVLGCASSKLVDVFLEFWVIDIAFADMAKNLYRAVKSKNKSAIMVTHDRTILTYVDTIYELKHGQLLKIEKFD